jgi:DNA invertase Pin-like site-specific DNA recombinase
MARIRKQTANPTTVVGYCRVSTDEQGDSGLGLAAQRAAIQAECDRRGWILAEVYEDVLSGRTLNRPGVAAALTAVESGAASTLIVAKLDRLSRSLLDFAGLMRQAQASDWNLVALDLGIDLSTPAGEFMANVMASAAQWERRIIGQRTRDALAVKRGQGVRLGRPQMLAADVVARIRSAHEAGTGWSALARQLNVEGVPTAHGGSKWYPSTVRAVVLSAEAAA